MPRQVTGRLLNHEWNVNASHALYREDGKWYHRLEFFPGALFDAEGYIVFETEKAFLDCPYLSIGDEVNVRTPNGISSIPGYIRVKE